jgi:hypothetical protein
MSLTGARPSDAAEGFIHTAEGQRCFYCDQFLHDPALHWMGATGSIYLHPLCWPDFSTRLALDFYAWQRQTGIYIGSMK